MQLPIKQLKEFVALSKFISSEKLELMPILQFIKLEIDFGECSITKDNLQEFVTYKFGVDCEDCSFILPYDKFSKYIASSNGEYCDININGDIVTVYDGYLRQKWNISKNRVDDFPKLPEISPTYYHFSKQLIEVLNLSKNITKPKDELRPQMACSHVTPICVYASDYNICFKKDISLDGLPFPSIPVSKTEVDCIYQLDNVQFSSSIKSHNIWKSGNVMYGFRQIDRAVDGFNYQQFFSNLSFPRKQYITLKLKDVISFCNSTKDFRIGLISNALLTLEDKTCIISYVEKETSEENKIEIDYKISQEFDFEFIFNTDLLLNAVLKFPHNDISICIDSYQHEGKQREIVYAFSENDESICMVLPTLGRESL